MPISFTKPAVRCKSLFLSFTFLTAIFLTPFNVNAQSAALEALNLPEPGTMIFDSPPYTPFLIEGITLDPNDPLKFDFLVDTGDSGLTGAAIGDETTKLVKYFLASLTIPENELWVNLSPYEGDQMLSPALGLTEMGRDLLAQDYILKQLASSLMYPESTLGQSFWKTAYQRATDLVGKEDAEAAINTFNKIWIIPVEAVVHEEGSTAYVVQSRLKVMLEEDYLAMTSNMKSERFGTEGMMKDNVERINNVSSSVVRDVLLPEIERQVNEGKHFAPLRQMTNSMILATWYKERMKESLLGQVYVDQNKIDGVDQDNPAVNEDIYDRYVAAFEEGAFDYIKEEYDLNTDQPVLRKYFSGGFTSENLANEVSRYNAPRRSLPQPIQNKIQELVLPASDTSQQVRVQFEMAAVSKGSNPQLREALDRAVRNNSTSNSLSTRRTVSRNGQPIVITSQGQEFSEDAFNRIDGAINLPGVTRFTVNANRSNPDKVIIRQKTSAGENVEITPAVAKDFERLSTMNINSFSLANRPSGGEVSIETADGQSVTAAGFTNPTIPQTVYRQLEQSGYDLHRAGDAQQFKAIALNNTLPADAIVIAENEIQVGSNFAQRGADIAGAQVFRVPSSVSTVPTDSVAYQVSPEQGRTATVNVPKGFLGPKATNYLAKQMNLPSGTQIIQNDYNSSDVLRVDNTVYVSQDAANRLRPLDEITEITLEPRRPVQMDRMVQRFDRQGREFELLGAEPNQAEAVLNAIESKGGVDLSGIRRVQFTPGLSNAPAVIEGETLFVNSTPENRSIEAIQQRPIYTLGTSAPTQTMHRQLVNRGGQEVEMEFQPGITAPAAEVAVNLLPYSNVARIDIGSVDTNVRRDNAISLTKQTADQFNSFVTQNPVTNYETAPAAQTVASRQHVIKGRDGQTVTVQSDPSFSSAEIQAISSMTELREGDEIVTTNNVDRGIGRFQNGNQVAIGRQTATDLHQLAGAVSSSNLVSLDSGISHRVHFTPMGGETVSQMESRGVPEPVVRDVIQRLETAGYDTTQYRSVEFRPMSGADVVTEDNRIYIRESMDTAAMPSSGLIIESLDSQNQQSRMRRQVVQGPTGAQMTVQAQGMSPAAVKTAAKLYTTDAGTRFVRDDSLSENRFSLNTQGSTAVPEYSFTSGTEESLARLDDVTRVSTGASPSFVQSMPVTMTDGTSKTIQVAGQNVNLPALEENLRGRGLLQGVDRVVVGGVEGGAIVVRGTTAYIPASAGATPTALARMSVNTLDTSSASTSLGRRTRFISSTGEQKDVVIQGPIDRAGMEVLDKMVSVPSGGRVIVTPTVRGAVQDGTNIYVGTEYAESLQRVASKPLVTTNTDTTSTRTVDIAGRSVNVYGDLTDNGARTIVQAFQFNPQTMEVDEPGGYEAAEINGISKVSRDVARAANVVGQRSVNLPAVTSTLQSFDGGIGLSNGESVTVRSNLNRNQVAAVANQLQNLGYNANEFDAIIHSPDLDTDVDVVFEGSAGQRRIYVKTPDINLASARTVSIPDSTMVREQAVNRRVGTGNIKTVGALSQSDVDVLQATGKIQAGDTVIVTPEVSQPMVVQQRNDGSKTLFMNPQAAAGVKTLANARKIELNTQTAELQQPAQSMDFDMAGRGVNKPVQVIGATVQDQVPLQNVVRTLQNRGVDISSVDTIEVVRPENIRGSNAVRVDRGRLLISQNSLYDPASLPTSVRNLNRSTPRYAGRNKNVGGINLDASLLNLQVKRDGSGVPLPVQQQPLMNMQIDGFVPILQNISPVSSVVPLPLLSGDMEAIPEPDAADNLSRL